MKLLRTPDASRVVAPFERTGSLHSEWAASALTISFSAQNWINRARPKQAGSRVIRTKKFMTEDMHLKCHILSGAFMACNAAQSPDATLTNGNSY